MFSKMRLGKRGAEKRFGITPAFLRRVTPRTNGQGMDVRTDLKRLLFLDDLFKRHIQQAMRRF